MSFISYPADRTEYSFSIFSLFVEAAMMVEFSANQWTKVIYDKIHLLSTLNDILLVFVHKLSRFLNISDVVGNRSSDGKAKVEGDQVLIVHTGWIVR